MNSNCLSGLALSIAKASPRRISAFMVKPQCSRFDLIVSIGARFRSLKRARDAPRLSASMPTAPVPANRSHQVEPATSPARILKSASLARSVIGRVVSPGTDFNLRPRAEPEMTLRLTSPPTPYHPRRGLLEGDGSQSYFLQPGY